jgi:hypothetical protein
MNHYLTLLLGVACAGAGGELFVRGTVGLARRARIPPGIVAATIFCLRYSLHGSLQRFAKHGVSAVPVAKLTHEPLSVNASLSLVSSSSMLASCSGTYAAPSSLTSANAFSISVMEFLETSRGWLQPVTHYKLRLLDALQQRQRHPRFGPQLD